MIKTNNMYIKHQLLVFFGSQNVKLVLMNVIFIS